MKPGIIPIPFNIYNYRVLNDRDWDGERSLADCHSAVADYFLQLRYSCAPRVRDFWPNKKNKTKLRTTCNQPNLVESLYLSGTSPRFLCDLSVSDVEILVYIIVHTTRVRVGSRENSHQKPNLTDRKSYCDSNTATNEGCNFRGA